ncbi:undecaprenyl-diphosphate phosphatase [candidate division KSB1 bacterium]
MVFDFLKSILLGIIQGLTEFLPVSSSGHIVLAKELFSIQSYGLLYEVMLHFGTFLSVLVIFRKEIYAICVSLVGGIAEAYREKSLKKLTNNPDSLLGVLIIVATIPGGVAGLVFKDTISCLFRNPLFVSFSLILTGIILYLTRFIKEQKKELSFMQAAIIGCAQICALIPGISRSGMTISTGIFCGISREKAVKFSFYLSLPLILGATILELIDSFSFSNPEVNSIQLLTGLITAFLFGYGAIKILLKVVIAGKFYLFSYYCAVAGIVSLIYFL